MTNENQVATWRAKKSGFSLKDKKSKFSLKSELRFMSTKFKPILIEEVSRNGMELLSLSEGKLIILLQVMSNADEMNYFFKNNYQNKNRDLREVRIKSLHEKEELKRVEELRIDESSRRRLIENQDTVHELTARIQELQNEVNCMNDSRDFKMLNQYAVDYSTFPVNQRYFHLTVILEGCEAVLGEC